MTTQETIELRRRFADDADVVAHRNEKWRLNAEQEQADQDRDRKDKQRQESEQYKDACENEQADNDVEVLTVTCTD